MIVNDVREHSYDEKDDSEESDCDLPKIQLVEDVSMPQLIEPIPIVTVSEEVVFN